MEVYGRLETPKRLLAPERDPVTGRRTVGRADKGDRHARQGEGPRSLRLTTSRSL